MVLDIIASPAMKTVKTEFLRHSVFFSGLDDSALEEIGRLMIVRDVKKHEILWLEQEPARIIYFVATGLIKLFKTSSGGKEQILRLARPGDCFGHAGALNGGSNPESVQAVIPSVLYGISRSDLEEMLRQYPQLTMNTIKLLATEMHHYISLVEDLSLRYVNGRLARMLLANNARGASEIFQNLTRADMAAMTGTVREVIGKSLRAMEDKGVIRYNRRKIIIRDKEALKTMVTSV